MIIVLLRVLKKRYRILTAGILGVKRIVGLAHEYLLGWLRGKGSPEGFPSGGGLGVSPSYPYSPLSLRSLETAVSSSALGARGHHPVKSDDPENILS
jgi:hypothetical protein